MAGKNLFNLDDFEDRFGTGGDNGRLVSIARNRTAVDTIIVRDEKEDLGREREPT